MGPMYMMCQKGDNSTTICCHLDLLLFGLEELGTDDMALMRKRVYDLAAVVGPDCQVGVHGVNMSTGEEGGREGGTGQYAALGGMGTVAV